MKDAACVLDPGLGSFFRVKSCKVGVDYLIAFLVTESDSDGDRW